MISNIFWKRLMVDGHWDQSRRMRRMRSRTLFSISKRLHQTIKFICFLITHPWTTAEVAAKQPLTPIYSNEAIYIHRLGRQMAIQLKTFLLDSFLGKLCNQKEQEEWEGRKSECTERNSSDIFFFNMNRRVRAYVRTYVGTGGFWFCPASTPPFQKLLRGRFLQMICYLRSISQFHGTPSSSAKQLLSVFGRY